MDQLDLSAKRDPSRLEREAVVTGRQPTDAERVLWAEFAEATTTESFCRS